MEAPRYSRRHVDNCAFAAWYGRLRHAAVKAEVVALPAAFVAFLLADGVELREDENASQAGDSEQQIAVNEVRGEVRSVLRQFGGKAFVKTNWSAPRDAAWMLGSLQCATVDDVLLLLQSSDFVVHDLTQPYAGCTPDPSDELEGSSSSNNSGGPVEPYLVIKKWCNFFDSMLFRCFVVGGALVGVSQRHCGEFYDFLLDRQDFLCERIFDFFTATFKNAPGAFPDPDFVFDVYVDKKHRVYLVDINVFGAVTDPLLFTWEELEGLRRTRQEEEDEVEEIVDFRIIESKQGIRANPLSGYRAPTDLVDHLAGGEGFEAFMEQVKRDNAAAGDASSDEDDE